MEFDSDQRAASSAEDLLRELSAEDRERYVRFWHRFSLLDRLGWLGLVILALPVLLDARFHQSYWRQISLTGLVLLVVSAIWIRLLHCPRCGVQFWGGLLTLLPRTPGVPWELGAFYVGKCWGCDLSRKQLSTLAKYE